MKHAFIEGLRRGFVKKQIWHAIRGKIGAGMPHAVVYMAIARNSFPGRLFHGEGPAGPFLRGEDGIHKSLSVY